jgi:TrfA protein
MTEQPKRSITEIQNRCAELAQTPVPHRTAQIIQLPLWPEPKRGTPNSFLRSALFPAIQSKDRRWMDKELVASQEGITVKFTGKQLNQEDLTLWETLVHMARQHPLGNTCEFTAHGILKAMQLGTGGREHERLHDGITRLIACAVEIRIKTPGELHGKKFIGSLIEGSVEEEASRHYRVRLSRDMMKLYGENEWTGIDWERRLKLRRKALAQFLHAYYSSHRNPYPVKLETLQRLSGSRNEQAADFKRKVRAALEELIEIGFLEKDSGIDGDMVTVKRVCVAPGLERR